MYRANADYHHKPYRDQISGSDIFYACTKAYIVLFTVFHLSVWYTNQPAFQFKNVYVRGAHSIATSDIKDIIYEPLNSKTLFFWNRNNALFYPKTSVEKKLRSVNSKLLSASVSLSRKNIYIDLVEYEPSFRYCLSPLNRVNSNQLTLPLNLQDGSTTITSAGEELSGAVEVPNEEESQLGLKEIPVVDVIEGGSHNCFWGDSKGYIFAAAPSYIGLPLLTITEKDPEKSLTFLSDNSSVGKNVFAENSLHSLNTIITLLSDSGLNVKQVLTLPNNDITVDVGYSFMVTMNLEKDPEESVDHLLLVLKELGVSATSTETKVKFIDVRFDNKVFYR